MNISQVLTKLKALIYSKSETDSLLGGKANSSHTHTKSQISDFPSLATVATSGSYSDLSNKPSSMTPSSHSHGNITNAGAIGTTANKPLITTTNGVITTGSFGTTANTFCQGNDSRLSDARTPTSHTHTKSQITDFPSLATVATSGSYSDLSNKPTIPSNNNQLTNGAGYITSSGSCNYANSADRANYLGDIGSTDRNSVSGTGWYSVGFSYSYDEGHNELAINNYWGIRLNCRDTNHVTINGSKINCDSDTTLNGYKIYVG